MPDVAQPPEFITLLAHDLRWNLLKALTSSDYRVQELVTLVDEPMNLVSYHLRKLRDHGVVSTRRSEADGRDIYYRLDLVRLRELYQAAGAALHPALSMTTDTGTAITPQRVLFVCTHNSARSQMAESLMHDLAGKSIEVYSAGNHPTGLHPDAISTMDEFGIDIRQQRSKNLQGFSGQSFDHIITVCDRAREVCPTFPGEHAHWGFADPAIIENAAERRRAFRQIAEQLSSRIEYFLAGLTPQHP